MDRIPLTRITRVQREALAEIIRGHLIIRDGKRMRLEGPREADGRTGWTCRICYPKEGESVPHLGNHYLHPKTFRTLLDHGLIERQGEYIERFRPFGMDHVWERYGITALGKGLLLGTHRCKNGGEVRPYPAILCSSCTETV